jgi:hypothetical protein
MRSRHSACWVPSLQGPGEIQYRNFNYNHTLLLRYVQSFSVCHISTNHTLAKTKKHVWFEISWTLHLCGMELVTWAKGDENDIYYLHFFIWHWLVHFLANQHQRLKDGGSIRLKIYKMTSKDGITIKLAKKILPCSNIVYTQMLAW